MGVVGVGFEGVVRVDLCTTAEEPARLFTFDERELFVESHL